MEHGNVNGVSNDNVIMARLMPVSQHSIHFSGQMARHAISGLAQPPSDAGNGGFDGNKHDKSFSARKIHLLLLGQSGNLRVDLLSCIKV